MHQQHAKSSKLEDHILSTVCNSIYSVSYLLFFLPSRTTGHVTSWYQCSTEIKIINWKWQNIPRVQWPGNLRHIRSRAARTQRSRIRIPFLGVSCGESFAVCTCLARGRLPAQGVLQAVWDGFIRWLLKWNEAERLTHKNWRNGRDSSFL
jgi:hypothetical protein